MTPRSPAHRHRLVRGLVVALVLLVPVVPGEAAAIRAPDEPVPMGVWPLSPRPEVAAAFDAATSPYGPGHRGVDLRGQPGQPVRAALPGTISFAGVLAGVAMVTVDHGGTRTTYQPVAPTVAVGAVVAAGSQIGTLGVVGSHCFPRACLHWGWIEGARTYLDPLRLVGGGPVRLLPLWRDQPVVGAARSPLTAYADWRPLAIALGGLFA